MSGMLGKLSSLASLALVLAAGDSSSIMSVSVSFVSWVSGALGATFSASRVAGTRRRLACCAARALLVGALPADTFLALAGEGAATFVGDGDSPAELALDSLGPLRVGVLTAARAREAAVPWSRREPEGVVLLGMGGGDAVVEPNDERGLTTGGERVAPTLDRGRGRSTLGGEARALARLDAVGLVGEPPVI